MLTDFLAQIADFLALGLAQIWRGRAFDDLLVTTLHRTVTFPQVVNITVAIAQDLHLDVAGADDHLFQIAFAIAKGRFGLATAFQNLFFQFIRPLDRAHAAPTAAPAGFQHQGVSDLGRLSTDRVHVVAQNLGGRDDGHARLDCDAPGAGLVTKRAHGGGFRANESDAVCFASVHEIGVFRQQAIAGVDRICPAFLGDADDFINRQICGDRSHAFADLIGLVRLEPVQAQLVFFGIDGDSLLAHFIGSAHHADGNFPTVRDQDF